MRLKLTAMQWEIFRKYVDSPTVEFVMSFCKAIVELNYCSSRMSNMYLVARTISMLTFATNNSRCVAMRCSPIELYYILYDCLIYFRSYEDYTIAPNSKITATLYATMLLVCNSWYVPMYMLVNLEFIYPIYRDFTCTNVVLAFSCICVWARERETELWTLWRPHIIKVDNLE